MKSSDPYMDAALAVLAVFWTIDLALLLWH